MNHRSVLAIGAGAVLLTVWSTTGVVALPRSVVPQFESHADAEVVLVAGKQGKKTYTAEEEDAYKTYSQLLKDDPNNEALKQCGMKPGMTKDKIIELYHICSGG
jgi:NADP-dependent 3-hydroxy acid dehydrogenase YdfG